MAEKEKRPAWFKLWLNQKPLIDAVPDDAVGKAFKAVYHYFETRELPELDSLSGAVFAVLKSQADEAIKDYNLSVEAGKAGANIRWGKGDHKSDSPPIDPLPHPIGGHGEDRRKNIEVNNILCSKAIQLLNDLAGSSFRPTTKATQRLIAAREKENYSWEDFEAVIRHQCSLWSKDDRMRKYLRPETLFGTKFEAYLSDAKRNEPKQEAEYVLAPLADPWEVAMREGANHA